MRVALISHLPFGAPYLLARLSETHDIVAILHQKKEPDSLKQRLRTLKNCTRDCRQKWLQRQTFLAAKRRMAWNKETRRTARKFANPHCIPDYFVTPNINNDQEALSMLRRSQPEICIVLGGRILKRHVLESVSCTWINAHGGVLPQYRGLWSEYWAVCRGDILNVGSTIHEVTTQVDAGAILSVERTIVNNDETLRMLMMRNHLNLVEHVVKTINDGKVLAKTQRSSIDAESVLFRPPQRALRNALLSSRIRDLVNTCH